MINLFSVNWWIQTFVSAFITLMCIWVLKKAFARVNVPVVSEIVAEA